MHCFQAPARRMLSVSVAMLFAVLLSGCGGGSGSSSTTTTPAPTPTPTPAPTPATSPYTSVVFLGDSLTAGFQNGSLLDTQQPHGYASLIATQANFSVTLPLIAPPGAPAVLQLLSTNFPPVIQQAPGVTTGRDNPTAQPTNLAVPGHKLHDLINDAPALVPVSDEDIITDLVLGFPVGNTNTQLAGAVALKPSTVFLWIGNDDALAADTHGDPSAMTSIASFTADFTQLMTTLKGTGANLVVANIPDVTAIPYLTPASEVANEFQSLSGVSGSAPIVEKLLGVSDGDLINAQGLEDVETALKQVQAGQTPTTLPLAAGDVLTAAEVVTVQATVNSYNQVIQQQAQANGATVVDLHAYFASLAGGITIGGVQATPSFLGGLFGLDGIHPTNTGYALVANQFIAALNTKFSSSLATVDVTAVSQSDPYFGPNIKATGDKATGAVRIPTVAARRSDQLVDGFRKRR